MVYGDGVSGKYSVIIEGRKRELLSNRHTLNSAQIELRIEQLNAFRQEVQHCKRPDFEQWYQLYKG